LEFRDFFCTGAFHEIIELTAGMSVERAAGLPVELAANLVVLVIF